MAKGPFLDGANPCRRYAGKLVQSSDRLAFMAFIQATPSSPFVGAVSDPIPVTVEADGRLLLHPEQVGEAANV